MSKNLRGTWGVVVAMLALVYAGSFIHVRWDLTSDQRFTLSSSTCRLLREMKEPVQITVFLEGDMPAGFRKLANSTRELLQEFKTYGGANFVFRFRKIGEGLEGAEKAHFLDSMARLGLRPYTIRVQVKKEEANEERTVVPGAIVEYKGKVRAVNFFSGISGSDIGYEVINRAENLLEYTFAHAIQQLLAEKTPVVGYLLGNGELQTQQIKSLMEDVLLNAYQVVPLPIDSFFLLPPAIDALVIMKPTQPFSDRQKLKIDQYVMHGGKVLWLVDRLYAELDSLMRSQSDFIAFDRNLNVDDLLFRYGVRINQDLLQDKQCEQIPMVVGSIGEQPQIELVDWQYFPLLQPATAHPISRNLNPVFSMFPQSIDTIATPGNQKKILLQSSPYARILHTPAIVSLNSVKTKADLAAFTRSAVPVAVSLEGSFASLFKNRISAGLKDSMQQLANRPFLDQVSGNKMIVISDADIAANSVSQQDGPLPMGVNPFSRASYANKEFLANCMEYLVQPSGIMETRNKEVALRLLDTGKTEQQRQFWQIANVLVPFFFLALFGWLFTLLRRKTWQSPPASL